MHVTKRIDLPLLDQELTTAGVPHVSVWLAGTDADGELGTYAPNDDGMLMPVDLPPEAAPVVDAHAAPPRVIERAEVREVSAVVRTSDDVPQEVFRVVTSPKHVYRTTFSMTAIDAGNGTTRDSEVRLVFKRLASSLSQVGTTVVLANAQDAAAASWRIQAAPQGTDLVITVTGAAGRVIDWLLLGDIGVYAPEGLS